MSEPLFIQQMLGLGDSLYCRAVIKEAAKRHFCYVATAWPQLLADLPVRCVKPQTSLRTQVKNIERLNGWHTLPGLVDARSLSYVRRAGTMLEALCQSIGVKAETIDFSGPPVAKVDREPYIVVRPVSRRTEWYSETREPKPEYIAQAVEALRKRYRVVSVADLQAPHEVAVEPLPYADETYHHGELRVEQLLELVAGAAAVVGGVGWLVPMALAYRTPMLLLYGGCLVHNGPSRIFDSRLDVSRIHQVMPDVPCMCSLAEHDCGKTISGLEQQIDSFMLRLAAGGKAPVAARTRPRVVSGHRTAV